MATITFKPKQVTKRITSHLHDRAEDVVLNRFGLTAEGEKKTLEEIGKKYGITRSRVMPYFFPISSRVFFSPSAVKPKRFKTTSSARSCKWEVILLVTCFGLKVIVAIKFSNLFLSLSNYTYT